MAQWRAAGPALDDQHQQELRELTDETAQAATIALLDLAGGSPIEPARWNDSGLVVQQALLHRRRSDGKPTHPGSG